MYVVKVNRKTCGYGSVDTTLNVVWLRWAQILVHDWYIGGNYTPDTPFGAVIHTFRGNHDATVVRFGYQARRNSQESCGFGARLPQRLCHNPWANTRDVSGVRSIRNSRTDRRQFSLGGVTREGGCWGDTWGVSFTGVYPVDGTP